jgi:hypothetical protein
VLAFLSALTGREGNLTAENFIYWLNGYFEISSSDKLSKEQVQIIRDHLKECFNKVTPNRSVGLKSVWHDNPPNIVCGLQSSNSFGDPLVTYSNTPPVSC